MQIPCTDKEQFIFKKIAGTAEELGIAVFLIGGFVRDKIIGRPTKDADIVCLGDGIALANRVAEKFHPRPYVSFFKNFGTAHLKINLSGSQYVNNPSPAAEGGGMRFLKLNL